MIMVILFIGLQIQVEQFKQTDGNNIVGVPLFDPVLAFPLVTDEVGSDIRWLNARFEQEDGNGSFNLNGYWDYGNDGVMTFRPDDNQPNGVYNLHDITIYDLAYRELYYVPYRWKSGL